MAITSKLPSIGNMYNLNKLQGMSVSDMSLKDQRELKETLLSHLSEIVELIANKYPPLDIEALSLYPQHYASSIRDYVIKSAEGINRWDIAEASELSTSHVFNLLGYKKIWSLEILHRLYSGIYKCLGEKQECYINPDRLLSQIESHYQEKVTFVPIDEFAKELNTTPNIVRKKYFNINRSTALFLLQTGLGTARTIRERNGGKIL